MTNLNESLSSYPVYPIEIDFYEDKEWSDLVRLQNDFRIT